METTQVSQESQVKEGSTLNGEKPVSKQPEEVRADAPNPLVGTLESAIKQTLDEMRHCDEQAGLWQERKLQLQNKMNETLASIQKQFSGNDEKKAPITRTRVDKNATVPELIRTFLEKNGAQRTKDIRKFLLAHGRKTNPGVALSRMLKNGDLKSTERGVYKIA